MIEGMKVVPTELCITVLVVGEQLYLASLQCSNEVAYKDISLLCKEDQCINGLQEGQESQHPKQCIGLSHGIQNSLWKESIKRH
jgi:hypothetical protein